MRRAHLAGLIVAAGAASALGGCWAEPELGCSEHPETGVDITLRGLAEGASYAFEIRAHDTTVVVTRTPSQTNGFAEAPIGDGRVLLASLFGTTLRVFVDDPVGDRRGPDELTVAVWSEDGLLVRESMAPAYERAEPIDPADCGGFAAARERLEIPPVAYP